MIYIDASITDTMRIKYKLYLPSVLVREMTAGIRGIVVSDIPIIQNNT